MLLHGDKFSEENLFAIKKKLERLKDNRFSRIIAQDYKKPKTMFWISLFFGWLGVDRFMLGHTKLGVAKLLLSLVTYLIWPLVDCMCFIRKATKTVNFEKFTRAIEEQETVKEQEQEIVKEQEMAKEEKGFWRTCKNCGYQEEISIVGSVLFGILDVINYGNKTGYAQEVAKRNLPMAMSYLNRKEEEERKGKACPKCGADDFYTSPRP